MFGSSFWSFIVIYSQRKQCEMHNNTGLSILTETQVEFFSSAFFPRLEQHSF